MPARSARLAPADGGVLGWGRVSLPPRRTGISAQGRIRPTPSPYTGERDGFDFRYARVVSVRRRMRANGHVVWQVAWRDANGRQRAETYPTRRKAEVRDNELRDLKWQDQIDAADAGRESLHAAAEAWWSDHVEPNLAPSTVLSYAHVLDVHLLPRLGQTPIRDIDPARVLALQGQLRASEVGGAMTHRILMVLSGIMRHAVLRGRVERNPVQPVRVVQPKRERAIRPLAPEAVEQIRRALLVAEDRASATLVSLMAYAGLRPAEATALCWRHVGQRTLLVEQTGDANGGTKATKTGAMRTVPLLSPLAADLAAWRAASGSPSGEAPIAPRADGGWWRGTDYRNWRRRQFDSAVERAGLERTRPYDLRHSYASLMVQAGYSPVELAAELGHSPTLTLSTYAHVFSEFARGERVRPEAAILAARQSGGSPSS
jgi:integrase